MATAQAQVQRPGGGPQVVRSYDKKAFQTLFPQYLDSNLTPSEGRRLTKAQSVSLPTLEEIASALSQLGYKEIIIDRSKSLPCSQGSDRFSVVPRGCVKVAIKRPVDEHYIKKSEFDTQTRNAVVPGIESKQEVLRRVAAIIKAKGGQRPEMPTVASILTAMTPNAPKVKK